MWTLLLWQYRTSTLTTLTCIKLQWLYGPAALQWSKKCLMLKVQTDVTEKRTYLKLLNLAADTLVLNVRSLRCESLCCEVSEGWEIKEQKDADCSSLFNIKGEAARLWKHSQHVDMVQMCGEDYFEVSEVPFLQVMSAQIKHTRHFIVSLHFKVYYIWVKWKLIWHI